MEVDIDLIRPSPYQPRLVFDLEDLKSEIEKDGLLSDLVVRQQGKFYEIIDGERRWRALRELGWKTVPVQVVDVDEKLARRSVYKLNKIRENYTVEEEARYFKKLADEGLSAWDISKDLNVSFHWVLAHLNVFKFPDDLQKAVWAKQISVSHIAALESVIERNIKEAVFTAKEILERKLTVSETRRIMDRREKDLKARVDEMRIRAAEEVLPAIAPRLPKLETPEEFERAAEALKEKAEEMREGVLKPEEIKRMPERLGEARQMEEEKSMQILGSLREKIETLEKEKVTLLEKKSFLTEALSFNCPYCSHACVIYREGDSYWVE